MIVAASLSAVLLSFVSPVLLVFIYILYAFSAAAASLLVSSSV
jgi:hypothetical protein